MVYTGVHIIGNWKFWLPRARIRMSELAGQLVKESCKHRLALTNAASAIEIQMVSITQFYVRNIYIYIHLYT